MSCPYKKNGAQCMGIQGDRKQAKSAVKAGQWFQPGIGGNYFSHVVTRHVVSLHVKNREGAFRTDEVGLFAGMSFSIEHSLQIDGF
ncbi:MAG: hypothetical protein AB9834_12010 [Lentimicrobium sp.]